MADINLFNISGKVTWHTHWLPKKWGGAIAIRLDMGNSKSKMFCTIEYQAKDANSDKVNSILKTLARPDARVAIIEGLLKCKVDKKGKTQHSIKGKIDNCIAYSDNQPDLNTVILAGVVASFKPDFSVVNTRYRNVKDNTWHTRSVHVFFPMFQKQGYIGFTGRRIYILGSLVATETTPYVEVENFRLL